MPNCSLCGKKIKFMHVDGANVIIDPALKTFRPGHGEGAYEFVTAYARRCIGTPGALDGIRGYDLHECH